MLELRGVGAGYGHLRVLHGVNLAVGQGEIVTVIGSNGAGKSTTLLTVAGIVRCTAGAIRFQGQEIQGWPAEENVRRGIVLVPEGRRIFPTLTVAENLLLGAYTRPRVSEWRPDLEKVFALFPALKARSRQLGSSLSGGEQQMLAIGRALMASPKLLLLDEPSLGLAPRLVDTIYDTVLAIKSSGVTILLVEQNAELALEIADRAYILERGTVVTSGTRADLLGDDRVRQAYLGV